MGAGYDWRRPSGNECDAKFPFDAGFADEDEDDEWEWEWVMWCACAWAGGAEDCWRGSLTS